VYVTGTSFAYKDSFCSVERMPIDYISSGIHVTTTDIIETLKKYWMFSFELRDMEDHLVAFTGRPYLFFKGIFEPLFQKLVLLKEHGLVSNKDEFIQFLEEQKQRMTAYFSAEVHTALSESKTELVPILLKSFLCSGGVISFNSYDEDDLKPALTSGITPLSLEDFFSTRARGGCMPINLTEVEPLVAKCVYTYFKEQMKEMRQREILEESLYKHVTRNNSMFNVAFAYFLALAGQFPVDSPPKLDSVLKRYYRGSSEDFECYEQLKCYDFGVKKVLVLTADNNRSFQPLINSSFHEHSTTLNSPACSVSPYILDTILSILIDSWGWI
jgi:hypothetical protein